MKNSNSVTVDTGMNEKTTTSDAAQLLTTQEAAGRLDEGGPSPMASTAPAPAMLTVDDVARILVCSARTVYRLTDANRLPSPVRLGSLVRWPRAAIENWIAQGCPGGRAGRSPRR